MELIPGNNLYHPKSDNIVAVFIHDYILKESYILPTNHPEGSKELTLSEILLSIAQKWPKTTVFNKKRALYHLEEDMPVNCLKTALYLNNKDIPNISDYDTPAHRFFYNKYPYKENINSIIPLTKHYEKFNNFVVSNPINFSLYETKSYEHYNNIVVKQLYNIEKNGIKIDKDLFYNNFHPRYDKMFIFDGIIHTEYNFFTKTGRPSNSFNGINFAALKKDNNERKSFVPRNDYFVEFDYNGYHPRFLADTVGYDFKDEDVYTHLAKLCFNVEKVSDEYRSEMKTIVFKHLYTDSGDYEHIEFFYKIKELKEYLWEQYNKKGYIISPISKRKLYNIDSKVKILPYLCLMWETERNSIILEKIEKILKFTDSSLILYTYDSFLFDYSKSDGTELLEEIKLILEGEKYSTSMKYGKNYGDLKKLT